MLGAVSWGSGGWCIMVCVEEAPRKTGLSSYWLRFNIINIQYSITRSVRVCIRLSAAIFLLAK